MAQVRRTHKCLATVNGASLYYETRGCGPAVIFVQTMTSDRRVWRDQVGPFAERFQVIRLDLRGFGRSSSPPGKYRNSADLCGLLDYLGIRQAVLVGLGEGGEIALEVALDRPKLVDALVLVNPTMHGWVPSEWPAGSEEILERLQAIGTVQDVPTKAFRALKVWRSIRRHGWVQPLDYSRFGPLRRWALAGRKTIMVSYNVGRLLTAYVTRPGRPPFWPEWGDPPVIERLSQIRIPTLIIRGERSLGPVGPQFLQFLQRSIPGAEVAIFSGLGTYPQMDQPELFNQTVFEFLGRHFATMASGNQPADL